MTPNVMKAAAAVLLALVAAYCLMRSGIFGAMAGVGAILFGVYVDAAFNVYSSLTSSPWTFENFSKDPERAKSCRKYVMMANVAAFILGLFGAIVSQSFWPLAGTLTVAGGMGYVYHRAIAKGENAGGAPAGDGWSSTAPAAA